jgi:hypothetical protein
VTLYDDMAALVEISAELDSTKKELKEAVRWLTLLLSNEGSKNGHTREMCHKFLAKERRCEVSDAKAADDEVRELLVTLITFIAETKASLDKKTEALEAVNDLRARLLP